MKDINPPSQRRPQKVGPVHPRKRKSDDTIRAIFIIGAILVLAILSQYIK